MNNADLIDLALCGGYVYEENVCDCCGHDNGQWVKAEMPLHGPRQNTISDQLYGLSLRRIEPYEKYFHSGPKRGMTINVKRPERWQQ